MDAPKILHELPKGLLNWYPFKENTQILYIGQDGDSLCELLWGKSVKVTVKEASAMISEETATFKDLQQKQYDYVVIPYAVERVQLPVRLLSVCNSMLKEDGVLLFGMNNRLGLRNFCGDKDPYTGRNFDGLENYVQVLPGEMKELGGREYAKSEMTGFLQQAGWNVHKFYSVLPNLSAPQLIYAPDYTPKEDLAIRYFPRYESPDTIFLNEENLYGDLILNGMFHEMANAYLVECAKQESVMASVRHATISAERSEEDALATVIYENNIVKKYPLYPQGQSKFESMIKNEKELQNRGIGMVPSCVENGVYTMPYINAPNGLVYLRELLVTDADAFKYAVDIYWEAILKSSDHSVDKDGNILLKKGYFDLVPLNSFWIDGQPHFYDQEFCVENLSAELLLYRTISLAYMGGLTFRAKCSIEEMWERYHLTEKVKDLAKQSHEFLSTLRNLKEQSVYLEHHQKRTEVVNSNRQRMNFSASEYQILFENIFDGLENRKLILFGSGLFTKTFLSMFGKDYEVFAIVDNNESKWGTQLSGVAIRSPEILNDLDPAEYKVIICIKKYLAVLQQLKDMGVRHIGIYDTNAEYPNRRRNAAFGVFSSNTDLQDGKDTTAPKKYNVGYIAGVFDLFHIGHLNLLRRAKEQCNHLIVGVVTDEGVRKNKKTEPVVPFEERIEIVRACKYVDEAVEIPFEYCGTREAYRMYHFDCQFSGSDYVDDPSWSASKEFLEKHGADLVFFPYTQSTSSTKRKEQLRERGE